MPIWLWVLDSLGVLLLLGILAVLGLGARRRLLARGGVTFDLSVNRRQEHEPGDARGWTLGIGRYNGHELQWFRTFSFSPRPAQTFQRGHVEVAGRRKPEGSESYALHAGNVVVETRMSDGTTQSFGLSPQALTGLLAWLESSPPGREVNNVI
ncbi:uncharacterized protein DUF2550 [Mumia flava]|uniref:Uncharacterized protein DUF2550 n=1 Tax=Mumia flava TaxID=1348852 RepID=A0A0B2BN27_9ACTN|nr:DUF2550 domain-containing protein [Mumia flava]PJJ56445.1 uncharacterized protein DUF2550 [Mumia flava]